ncbi:FAD-dependent oxidoreductase [Amycolatopsis ultiminotia]|uniref:FAD-dependent oxidoreductase n=1 Tax=Amycolatopsis ultiminotia TaxID=543629 RepID=A0ABP6WBF7_9PSEU
MNEYETAVVIVGGGPVGLTLAHELGSRGIACVLLEPREATSSGSPRCKQVNPRSMEIFRRLGVADDIRAASGLPFGWSDSAVFATSLTGHRIERFDQIFALSGAGATELAEPAQWCAQNRLEEALRETLRRRTSVTPLWGATLTGIEQDETGVTAIADGPDGAALRIRGRYLAGADGSRSSVRRLLGIRLSGRSHEIRNLQTTFRAPGLDRAHDHGRAVQYWIVNDRVNGLMGQLDTEDTWWAIILGAPAAPSSDWVRDALTTMIGAPHPVEVLAHDPWTARMLIADEYRAGRCFLLGDAAHLNPPWGGFGANTGIGDAVDLGWKLAAAVEGWAGPQLLDSYQAERRRMGLRTIAEAERNMQVLPGELARPELDDDGPAGAHARREAAAAIRRTKTSELYTLGFVLGARYLGSPLLADDDGPAPGSTTSHYRPSAAPGVRLPHLWQAAGRSLYDALGPGFTLLELGEPAGPQWAAAAGARGLPLTRFRLHRPDLRELTGADLLLVRPDRHVAWRGSSREPDPAAVLDRARGGTSTNAESSARFDAEARK